MDRNEGGQAAPFVRREELIEKVFREIKKRRGTPRYPEEDIAVIGLSGRYPMAENLEAFWNNLRNGKNCISEIPPERWAWEKYFDPNATRQGSHYTRWGGFISEADKFDPLFFNIAPREAEMMDPQERLFLETAWSLIEDAGYTVKELKACSDPVGVFVGIMNNAYGLLKAEAWRRGQWSGGPASFWSAANRVSYALDFHGPSLAVDTACSSSLTAIHLACESIKKGECNLAIAGGVNLILHPIQLVGLSSAGMLSKGEQCKTFGQGADGFVAGEGVGAVLLKPLAQAVADHDHIYGVIKGSHINSGGKTGGYTVPNPNAQADLIAKVLEKTGIHPRSIRYLEAHGTGTELGDPIEIAGLVKAFSRHTNDKQFCAIGSVKSNIGHLESAAGIAGLTKILLQLKYKALVPSIHSAVLNPRIDFAQSPFAVQRRLADWPDTVIEEEGRPVRYPRRAGLSSFGAGGANVHLIVEEAPQPSGPEIATGLQTPAESSPQAIVLSAESKEQLKEYAGRLYSWLEKQAPIAGLESTAYTLQTGREAMPERLAVVAQNAQELKSGLEEYLRDAEQPPSGKVWSGTAGENEALKALLSEGRAAGAFLRTLMEEKDFKKLAALWACGVRIDWKELYRKRRPERVALPTYPFKRKRYWIHSTTENGEAEAVPAVENRAAKGTKAENPEGRVVLKPYAGKEKQIPEPQPAAKRIALKAIGGERPAGAAKSPCFSNQPPLVEKEKEPAEAETRGLTGGKAALPGEMAGTLNRPREDMEANRTPARQQDPRRESTAPEALLAEVRREIMRTLYVEEADLHDEKPLAEYGMDSILAVELIKRLNIRFGLSLKANKLYDYGTARSLAGYIRTQGGRPVQGAASAESGESKTENDFWMEPLSETKGRGEPSRPGERSATRSGEERIQETDIAVIGMAGRFPGADHIEAFWENVKNGVDSVVEVPRERWDAERYFDATGKDPDRSYCKWGGFIEGIDRFDNRFFDISPAEAEKLMPEQRIVLEEAWHAFENAGYSPNMLNRLNCGIYLGVMGNIEYPANHVYNAHSIMAARLAYLLNLKGPALAIDAACSSSLVAVHLACRSLMEEETDLMLAGGVSLYLNEKAFIGLSKAGMLSARGRCRVFDDAADGFVPGEGAGFLVLKKLSKAVKDNDFIHGVIKGSAINQDGRTNGLTAPSSESQKALELRVYEKYAIQPESITLVEAHGTGTKLGDPIEIDALTDAFRVYTAQKQFCAIGSVKSNIGHASAAAGVAGMIKVLLSLRHRKIPPTLHCARENRQIAFAESPFYVNRRLTEWVSKDGAPRRAAVSGFGYSGTNAHLVVEEYCPKETERPQNAGEQSRDRLIFLSAKSETSLQQSVRNLLSYLEPSDAGASPIDIDDLAHALYFGREEMDERIAVVADSLATLKSRLRTALENRTDRGLYRGRATSRSTPGGQEELIQVKAGLPSLPGPAEKAAQDWVKGKGNGWQAWFRKGKYKKVPLPVYPFAGNRFWYTAGSESFRDAAGGQPQGKMRGPASGCGDNEFEPFLIQLVAEETKYASEQIDADVDLEHYGIDSVMIVNLNRKLEAVLGKELSKTLFFEYRSIGRLAEFLKRKYGHLPQTAAGLEAHPPAPDTPDTGPAPAVKEALPGPSAWTQAGRQETGWVDLAIIGMSGVFPKADTLEQFWDNLKNGRDCITEIPAERWDYQKYYDPLKGKAGKIYAKWGGFINGVELFDPYFFNISPKDAESMDPQERLFLQTAWHTLEDAGYTRESLKAWPVGVFVGVTYNEYQFFGKERGDAVVPPPAVHASIANRVSYFFNFSGPSLVVDTMCSSSLVAVYLACQGIRNGDCGLALAGGVNVSIHANKYLQLSENRFLSSDGRCRSFGEGGDGYVPGEGVGAVLLKPLAQAVRDHDHIYGVIKGGAMNHGGKTNGYTVPNPQAQSAVIQKALQRTGWDPQTIGYIEAHGTGTALGDPVEISGLVQAFNSVATARGEPYCAIGSVKSNIGHLEPAAGISGLIKILLQMKHGLLAPSLHAETLNGNLNLEQTPFFIQRTLCAWKGIAVPKEDGTLEHVQRAGLSSFGAGGANAHLLLESYRESTQADRRPQEDTGNLILLSAKSPESLDESSRLLLLELERRLKEEGEEEFPGSFLQDLAYTLQTGREPMPERLAIAVKDREELVRVLRQYCGGARSLSPLYRGQVSPQHLKTPFLPEVSKLVGRIIQKRNYRALAQLWIKGKKIDWEELYAKGKPGRISLPLYPFQKEKYWYGPSADAPAAVKASRPVSGADQDAALQESRAETKRIEDAYLVQDSRPKESFLKAEASAAPSVLMVLGQDDLFYQRLKKSLQRPGDQFLLVEQGPHFRKISKEHYTIHPEKAADYFKLFVSVAEDRLIPERVIHQWVLPAAKRNQAGVAENLTIGFYSACHLLQAFLSLQAVKDLRFYFLYPGQNDPTPEFAALGAWLRAIQREHANIKGCLMQIDEAILRQPDSAAGNLLFEQIAEPFERVIEITVDEKGARESYLKQIRDPAGGEALFKENRVYLISGGAGGLGRLFARHLMDRYHAQIVLAGRSGAPDLKTNGHGQGKGIQGGLTYMQADVSERGQVLRLIGAVREKFGALHGVIHCAGIMRNASLKNKTKEEMESVLAPKVFGTIHLDEATQEDALDFFIMFSSITTVIGNIGNSDYAFANAFMDYYAGYRSRLSAAGKRKGKTLSIDWPLWRDGGLAIDAAIAALYTRTTGLQPIDREAGIRLLEGAVRAEKNHIIPVFGEKQLIVKALQINADSGGDRKTAAADDGQEPASNPVLRALMDEIADWLCAITKTKKEQIHPDKEFGDYGLDSVGFTEMAGRINNQYRVETAPPLFYEYKTIRSVADYLWNRYRTAIEEYCQTRQADHSGDGAPKAPPIKIIENKTAGSGVPGAQRADHPRERVAIIGLGCRMPQSDRAAEFWRHLVEGRSLITEIPKDRWDWEQYYGDPLKEENKTNVKWGGFLKGVDLFDASFFGISRAEAMVMDPRQKLLLETVHVAIEGAGYRLSDLKGKRIGVFIGASNADYADLLKEKRVGISAESATGTAQALLANRISYFYDFHGPSETIDTACSSSLVAVQRAIECIQNGSCDTAVAGGVHLLFTPQGYMALNKAGMLSPTGRCRPFDQDADGYVRGEGVGVVFLKRLPQAIAERDSIYATILGSSVNHGGRAHSLTAPNPEAQAELIIEAFQKSKTDPRTIRYIETHGTGTKIGDPIEINALIKAWKELSAGSGAETAATCGLGSVKSNIGHLEAAAGIAGLIKILLAFRHEKIPATAHFKRLNPYISLAGTPFYIQQETTDWEPWGDDQNGLRPRRAAISSFGFGGSNAHMILEEYKPNGGRVIKRRAARPLIFTLSAKNPVYLKAYAKDFVDFIEESRTNQGAEAIGLLDTVYTLQKGRDEFPARLAFAAETLDEVEGVLKIFLEGGTHPKIHSHVLPPAGRPDGAGEPGAGEERQVLKQRGLLDQIAQQWSRGAKIAWEELFAEEYREAVRVPLPTHPFLKEHLGITGCDNKERDAAGRTFMKETPKGAAAGNNGWSPEDIRETLLRVLAEKAAIDVAQLSFYRNFSEYGITSVNQIMIVNDLIGKMDFLSSAADGDHLLKCYSIHELVTYIAEKSKNGTARPSAREQKSLAEIHERQNRNGVSQAPNLISEKPFVLSGTLAVDESHAFFFDHPLDHISGIHLLKAMDEVIKTGFVFQNRLDPSSPLFVSRVRAVFTAICGKESAAMVVAQEMAGGQNGQALYKAEIKKGAIRFAEAEFSVGKAEPAAQSLKVRSPQAAKCDKQIVNKWNESNIYVSDLLAGDPMQCQLLTGGPQAYFAECREGWIDMVVLLEAARQAFKVFAWHLSRNAESAAAPVRQPLNLLKEMELSVERPLSVMDEIRFMFEDKSIQIVGSNVICQIRGALQADAAKVGHFNIVCLLLNSEIFKRAKAEGGPSAVRP